MEELSALLLLPERWSSLPESVPLSILCNLSARETNRTGGVGTINPSLPDFDKMRAASFIFVLAAVSSAKTFSVIHNTNDPAEFGTKGGAALNASETGDDYVDAFTICIRFQGRGSKMI